MIIDEDLHSFIQSSIKSVWMLEMLLYLRRNSHRSWGPDELVRELRGSESVVSQGATGLLEAGLIAVDGDRLQYAPSAPLLDLLAAKLETTYAQKPSSVIRAIHSAPGDKLQTFSDAFKLRRD